MPDLPRLPELPATPDPDDPVLPTAAFLRALYQGLLRREPDAASLHGRLAALGPALGHGVAARLAAEFAGSREFRQLHAPTTQPAAPANPPAQPHSPNPTGNEPGNTAATPIIPLGDFCYPAWTLQRYGLRRAAMPFDWIFSTPDMIAHCLDDDFATLLDPREYRPHAIADRIHPDIDLAGHASYEARFGRTSIFNHYDPTDPARHAYLHRCVARFRAVLASGTPTRFFTAVAVARAPDQAEPFRRLAAALTRATPTGQLLMLAIVPPRHDGTIGTTRIDQIGPHRLMALRPLSHLNGLEFTNPTDDHIVRHLLAEWR